MKKPKEGLKPSLEGGCSSEEKVETVARMAGHIQLYTLEKS